MKNKNSRPGFGKKATDFEQGAGAMQTGTAQLDGFKARKNLKCLGSCNLILKYMYASLSEMSKVPASYPIF